MIIKNPKMDVKKNKSELSNNFKRVEKNLADILEVKVEIKTAANGKKGKIVLDFKNEEELEQILAHFK